MSASISFVQIMSICPKCERGKSHASIDTAVSPPMLLFLQETKSSNMVGHAYSTQSE